jgi:hypothetical protein
MIVQVQHDTVATGFRGFASASRRLARAISARRAAARASKLEMPGTA